MSTIIKDTFTFKLSGLCVFLFLNVVVIDWSDVATRKYFFVCVCLFIFSCPETVSRWWGFNFSLSRYMNRLRDDDSKTQVKSDDDT